MNSGIFNGIKFRNTKPEVELSEFVSKKETLNKTIRQLVKNSNEKTEEINKLKKEKLKQIKEKKALQEQIERFKEEVEKIKESEKSNAEKEVLLKIITEQEEKIAELKEVDESRKENLRSINARYSDIYHKYRHKQIELDEKLKEKIERMSAGMDRRDAIIQGKIDEINELRDKNFSVVDDCIFYPLGLPVFCEDQRHIFFVTKHFIEQCRDRSLITVNSKFFKTLSHLIKESIIILNRPNHAKLIIKHEYSDAIYFWNQRYNIIMVCEENEYTNSYDLLKTVYTADDCGWFDTWKKKNKTAKKTTVGEYFSPKKRLTL